jgi:hypothetical protein
MNPLFFAQKRQGPLFVYYYRADERRIIDKPFPEVPEQEWWSKWDYRPHDLYNVSGLSPVQNAVYLALAWRLIKNLKCLAIPTWHRDHVAEETKLTYELVNWEYSLQSVDKNWRLEDLGFVEPRTSPGHLNPDDTYADAWKAQNKNKAGLFPIRSWKEFINIQKPSLVQAMSETNYFAFRTQESIDKFINALKSKSQPQLKKLLTQGDIFIDIILGMDMGYPDAFLIKSGQDISAKLDALVDEYNLAAEKYETRMAEIYEMDDFVNALTELVGVDN